MAGKAAPRFTQLNIVSGDTEASLRFYRKLGLEIPNSAIWKTQTGPHHISAQALLKGDGATMDIDSALFAGHWNNAWQGRRDLAGRVVISFEVPSRERVDVLYNEMAAAGYSSLQPPYDALWGARYAIIQDPDGIAVGIMSPISAEQKLPPPAI